MAVLNIDDTQFSKIQQVNFTSSGKISSDKYVIDENNNIVFNDPIINAIDIDWNNAKHPNIDKTINTSGDLINVIGNLSSSVGDINEIVNKIEIPKSIYDLSGSANLLTYNDIAALKPQLTGKSAYEAAKEIYESTYGTDFPYLTEESWIASLKGEPGQRGFPGTNGKSAYEIAKSYYQSIGKEFPYSTEEAWIDDIISGEEHSKSYTDNQLSILNNQLLKHISENETTIVPVNDDHLEIKLIETEHKYLDDNNNEITEYTPPYKYLIQLKDVASQHDVDGINARLETFATSELLERIDERINELIGGASDAYDTFEEIEKWINDLPMNPSEVAKSINDIIQNINDLTGTLTEEKEQIDDDGNITTIEVNKKFDKTGDDYAQSIEQLNDIINNLLNSVSTAKDVQDGAEENLIDAIIGEDQSFTINNEDIIAKFINVNKPEGSKVVTLGVNKTLLNNIIEDNNATVINQAYNKSKTYIDDKTSWKVVNQ